jgi:HEAT repeat protein
VAREAAVARLTVIGSRAVERLIAVATSEADSADARAAAWRALDAIGDARALEPALRTLGSTATPPAIAAAAAGVARGFIRGPHGAAAVDRLTLVALDRARPETVRVAALRALRTLEPATLAPLLKSLEDDPRAAVRAEAEPRVPSRRTSPREAALVAAAAQRGLGDDPAALRAAIARDGASVPLATLLRIVERVREREGAERPALRDEWRLVRAAAHQALADRGSRIALYDLRESLESANSRLPVEFLTPLQRVGDASCLEAIAAAHARSSDAWTRGRLADAFYSIVAREKLTQRHAVMKRVARRWKGLAGG